MSSSNSVEELSTIAGGTLKFRKSDEPCSISGEGASITGSVGGGSGYAKLHDGGVEISV